MQKDNRKMKRRPFRYSAWMAVDNDKLHGCVLADISDSGARLDVEDSKAVPDHFMLLLSGTGAARRTCRVIWRAPAQVGVAFEQRLSDTAAVTLAPKVDADTDAAKPATETETKTTVTA